MAGQLVAVAPLSKIESGIPFRLVTCFHAAGLYWVDRIATGSHVDLSTNDSLIPVLVKLRKRTLAVSGSNDT
jgi:hypothetical protein